VCAELVAGGRRKDSPVNDVSADRSRRTLVSDTARVQRIGVEFFRPTRFGCAVAENRQEVENEKTKLLGDRADTLVLGVEFVMQKSRVACIENWEYGNHHTESVFIGKLSKLSQRPLDGIAR